MKSLWAVVCLCGLLLAAEGPGVWLDVPFVKQEKNGCGAASIAMVMQYWARQQGKPEPGVDPAKIQRLLSSPGGSGIHASDLQRYFEQHGYQAFAFRGTWDDLRQHLEKGRPLIVALKPASHSSDLHYVVVTGMDWEHKVVLVNDPAQRKLLKQDQGDFEKQWSAVDKWTLLALPR